MDDTDLSPSMELPWLVIRQAENGRHYRVSRYSTRAEAETVANALTRGDGELLWTESASGHILNARGPEDANRKTSRHIERARPLFRALTAVLPADDRERWCEEWTAEWLDLTEQPLPARAAFLMRVSLRSGPRLAWTLRLTAQRQRAR
ncbi:hypothetical protein [Streptomyces longisporus]|uniref:Uncharacterized protein n=1 Tax=Streptomyces longisporus TaxID=1948 RepID=A0ABP6AUY6_STRLO